MTIENGEAGLSVRTKLNALIGNSEEALAVSKTAMQTATESNVIATTAQSTADANTAAIVALVALVVL